MLDATTQFIVDLFILFAAAVAAGEVANHLGQVAMVGQLLVGVVLGPTLLGNYLGLTSLSSYLQSIQILATIFILFMSGMEVRPEALYKRGGSIIVLGLAIFLGPFLATSGLALLLEPSLGLYTDLYIGLTLSITALPVMAIMLSEFGLLQSKLGQLLMGTALVNEFAAVTVFAILEQVSTSSGIGYWGVAKALVSVALFVSTMLTIHMVLRILREARLWKPLVAAFSTTWRSKQGGFALLMILVVGATVLSQTLGLTYVVGAFYAGMLITRESAGAEAHREISTVFDNLSWGFFVPLFFAFVGVEMNLQLIANPFMVGIFLSFFAVAIVSKVGIGIGGARQLGYRLPDSEAIGIMLAARGAVELAMATIIYTDGLISQTMFTIIAGVGLLTTIVAPIVALSAWLSDPQSRAELFQRVPALRPKSPSLRQLKPPADWGALMGGGDSGNTLLREWLKNRHPEDRTTSEPSATGAPSTTSSTAKETSPLPSEGPPPLPKARKPPPRT